MNFEIESSELFLKQVEKLSPKSKKLIMNKFNLISQNPFRFNGIHSNKYKYLFRIRLNLDGKECRLIYAIIQSKIRIACILERKDDYRDLERILEMS
jgi:mRNA-degrading endonuclease RelE of RelBE toxin-antitoxin system